jgi:hypothetical protein
VDVGDTVGEFYSRLALEHDLGYRKKLSLPQIQGWYPPFHKEISSSYSPCTRVPSFIHCSLPTRLLVRRATPRTSDIPGEFPTLYRIVLPPKVVPCNHIAIPNSFG